MRLSIILFTVLLAPVTVAAEHPTWANLAKLYGLAKDSETVKAFIREHELKETTKGPSGSFSPNDNAYSILYDANRVKTIILKVTPPLGGFAQDDWRAYSGTLPYKLVAKDGRSGVVKKLGQPTKPSGDTWHHDGLEIWVFFNSDESGINELYIWPLEEGKQP